MHAQIAQMPLSEPEPFSHPKERLLGMVSAGYDGLTPAILSRLNHSRAASADSTRRLFIPIATGDSFAGMMGSLASKLFVFINKKAYSAEGVP